MAKLEISESPNLAMENDDEGPANAEEQPSKKRRPSSQRPVSDVVKWLLDGSAPIAFVQRAADGNVYCGRLVMSILGTQQAEKRVHCWDKCGTQDDEVCPCLCHILKKHYNERKRTAATMLDEDQAGQTVPWS